MPERRLIETNPDDVTRVVPRNSTPLASIILPVFNAEAHLTTALENLREVDCDSHEIVIIDDGSTDATWKILSSADLPVPATLIRLTKNAGVARARNIALRATAGEFIWMIDGDDRWPADGLRKMLDAGLASGAGIVVGSATKVVVATGERMPVTVPSRTGTFDQRQTLVSLLEGGLRGHLWNKLFRRDRLPVDPFPVLRSKSDYCMIIESLPALRDMVVITDDVYEYRYQLGSITNSKRATPLDLFRCYEATMRAVEAESWDLYPRRAVEEFKFFSIAQIALSEVWRFGENAVNGPEAAQYVRGLLTSRGFFALLPRQPLRRIVTAAGLKYAPGLLAHVYRQHRAKRWTS